jgi:hypothetical protein
MSNVEMLKFVCHTRFFFSFKFNTSPLKSPPQYKGHKKELNASISKYLTLFVCNQFVPIAATANKSDKEILTEGQII